MSEVQPTIEDKGVLFSEAALLAGVSAVVYLCAFLYESAFIGYFGVPWDLARVELKTVIVMAVVLLTTFAFLFPAFHVVFTLVPATSSRLKRVVFIWSWAIVMTGFYVASLGIARWKQWIWVVGFWVLRAVIDFLPPLFSRNREGGYWERWDSSQAADYEKARGSFFYDAVIRPLGDKGLGIMLIAITVFTLSNLVGTYSARQQKEFLIIKGPKELVILRVYDDGTAIVASLLRAERRVRKELRVMNLSADPNLLLSVEKVGPLAPELP